MTFYGLMYMARYMACQYGDGLSNAEFWKSDIYLYNLKGKVKNHILTTASKLITRCLGDLFRHLTNRSR